MLFHCRASERRNSEPRRNEQSRASHPRPHLRPPRENYGNPPTACDDDECTYVSNEGKIKGRKDGGGQDVVGRLLNWFLCFLFQIFRSSVRGPALCVLWVLCLFPNPNIAPSMPSLPPFKSCLSLPQHPLPPTATHPSTPTPSTLKTTSDLARSIPIEQPTEEEPDPGQQVRGRAGGLEEV